MKLVIEQILLELAEKKNKLYWTNESTSLSTNELCI